MGTDRNRLYKHTNYGIMLSITVLLTVLSQLPIIVENSISSITATGMWLIALLYYGYVSKSIKFNHILNAPVLVGITLIVFAVTMHLTDGSGYIGTKLFRSYLLSVFVLFIGTLFGTKIHACDLDLCNAVYVIAAFIVSLSIYLQFFLGKDINGPSYLYASKNSIGVIILTAIIIITCNYHKLGKGIYKFIAVMLIIAFVTIITLMKSRAVLVTIPIIAAFSIIASSVKKQTKTVLIIAAIVAIILLQNEQLHRFFTENILYAKRGNSLLESSSGRVNEWESFFNNMQGIWLYGDGKTKREALILTACIQYGFPMGITIFLYALWPVKWAICHKAFKNRDVFALFLVAFSYLFNSFFEQLSPFGPGVRCFYLWLLLGILSANKRIREKNNAGAE